MKIDKSHVSPSQLQKLAAFYDPKLEKVQMNLFITFEM